MEKKYSYILKSKRKVVHLKLDNKFVLGNEITFELDGTVHTFSGIHSSSDNGVVTTLYASKHHTSYLATEVNMCDRI